MTFFDNLERYQNLLVGAIGFVGVTLTLWFNARQARNVRAAERAQERESTRSALTAELEIHRAALRGNIEGIDPEREQGAMVPTDPMDDAFKAFLPSVGLLSETEVAKVMKAYLLLRTLNAKLYLVGVPVRTSDRHVNVPPDNLPLLRGMLGAALPVVEEAIDELKDTNRPC